MIVRGDAVKTFDFNGLSIRAYTAGQATSSSLALIDVPVGSRHQRAYSKRSDKYYFLAHGELRFTVDGEAHDLRQGDFCLIAKGVRFSYENRSKERAMLVLLHTPSFDLDSEVLLDDGEST